MTDQTAVLACFIDFQKAFMRVNHNILIEKLSNLGVPGWLLIIVISFLTDRSMFVLYKGGQSSVKQLPGGGPQGTLLALLLFLVMINDVGFENQLNNAGELATAKRKIKTANEIHLKFVDDLTVAEAVKMKQDLTSIPPESRPLPDAYHSRTGHILPESKSKVYNQLQKTQLYCKENQMKINFKKTKMMLFNPSKTLDFMPHF